MVLFITKKFYCCLFVFASLTAGAQTTFTASLTPPQSGRDEYITLRLTVANGTDVRTIQPPSLNNFIIVSGPHPETEMINTNGAITQYISLNYVLLPKKSGAYTLGAATAVVNGKTYRSKAIAGLVTNKKTAGRPHSPYTALQMSPGFDPVDEPKPTQQFDDYILRKGETVPEKVNRNMQLKLQTDKTSCYIGEPILASYKLYTRLRSESNLSKNPSFNGFSVVDMTAEDPMNFKRETLKGREYNVYTIRKAQLYPLQAGNIELETAILDNKIEFLRTNGPSNAYTGDPGAVVKENVSLSTKPFSVLVKPLPEEGKPAGFNGAVGNFRIQSSLERNRFSSQETGKLLVTVSGSGNMHLLTAPEIKWPVGFENFDVKCVDKTDNNTIPLSGSKTFEMPFSVSAPGNYRTPAITFSFFDPAAGIYKTITAATQEFTITPGANKPATNFYTTENQPETGLMNNIFENRWLIILFLAGIIISGIILRMSREKKTTAVQQEETEPSEPTAELSPAVFPDHNPLMKTEECLQNEGCVEFYSVLNGELRQFLSEKFAPGTEFLTSKTLALAMDKAGTDNDAILRTQQLLLEIEFELYTPFEQNEKSHRVYAESQTLVQILNMQKSNP
ncbi:MAG: BatD family protein [Ferruginibacter sp.]